MEAEQEEQTDFYREHNICASCGASLSEYWRSIESAPQDGTWILVWTVDDIDDSKWCRNAVVKWRTVGRNRLDAAGWYDDRIFAVHAVTHWQPLPKPPGT